MILKYALFVDEYVESQSVFRTRMATGRFLFRNLVGLAFLLALLGIDLRFSASTLLGDLLFLVAAALLLERTLLWRLRTAARYRQVAALREPVELKIDESNLLRTSTAGTEEIRWANILACHETKNLFLLRLEPDDLLTLPKRAFSPGDLFHFNELLKKELIVRTTRQNPDIVLLRFVVAWGVIAIALMALSIGYVHNFLMQLPAARPASISSQRTNALAANSSPATPTELRGRGTVYLVPLGDIKSVSIQKMIEDIRLRYGPELHLLPAISPPAWTRNTARRQFVAEDLVEAMKIAYPNLAADPSAIMIGLTDEDMYIQALNWSYAFSFRDEERFAVISAARLSENGEDEKPATPEILQKRLNKVLVRDIGILHYRLQPSNDYRSILYRNIDESSELDEIGDDYLESDVRVRADLHVENGDPCFILRHYDPPDREIPIVGSVSGCSGYYKELNLETVQIDLRYGLLLDQHTDFLTSDRFPLDLTRVLRTQDSRSRAFGIGGNHNLNIFLVGDKWPFTWIDVVLEHGGRSHFRRSNWGFGYWDARYTNRDANPSEFGGSTIKWAWPGWKLERGSTTYLFADGRANRPEQAALLSIQRYDGSRLTLDRDRAGNLLVARSSARSELAFKYDPENRVIEINQKDGGHFNYSYDAKGHLARVTDADQGVTEYGYDEAGHMNRITRDGHLLCTMDYDGSDRVKAETLADGRNYQFDYVVSNNGGIIRVDITDSAGPARRVRMSEMDYTLDVQPLGKR
jgi:YD repeat-containing protein